LEDQRGKDFARHLAGIMKNPRYADYTIRLADGEELTVHKSFLAEFMPRFSSDIFQNMQERNLLQLASDYESQVIYFFLSCFIYIIIVVVLFFYFYFYFIYINAFLVNIQPIDKKTVELLLEFIYTGTLAEHPGEQLPSLLALAEYLQIDFIVEQCCVLMSENVDTDNCYALWDWANLHTEEYDQLPPDSLNGDSPLTAFSGFAYHKRQREFDTNEENRKSVVAGRSKVSFASWQKLKDACSEAITKLDYSFGGEAAAATATAATAAGGSSPGDRLHSPAKRRILRKKLLAERKRGSVGSGGGSTLSSDSPDAGKSGQNESSPATPTRAAFRFGKRNASKRTNSKSEPAAAPSTEGFSFASPEGDGGSGIVDTPGFSLTFSLTPPPSTSLESSSVPFTFSFSPSTEEGGLKQDPQQAKEEASSSSPSPSPQYHHHPRLSIDEQQPHFGFVETTPENAIKLPIMHSPERIFLFQRQQTTAWKQRSSGFLGTQMSIQGIFPYYFNKVFN